MPNTDLSDRVNRDPELNADEKETTISMYGQDKHFRIHTAKPTVIKSLLKHDHFELEWARVIGADEANQLEARSQVKETDGDIVAVTGQMPVGVLTVKSKPRANNHQSSIVNSETIDSSVFE